MNREGKKCFLYLRVSTEMQVDGYSLEAQKNCLKKFAEREELVIAGVYEDAGKSGKSISVLSAVAEIERENILEQTMNGRREKARQGKWNGGPAPYGYMIKDEILSINEEEAEIVRTIYDKYVNTRLGYSGIAKYFNLQGIRKTPRKESDIEA